MDPKFRARIESLEPLLSQLKAMTPVKPDGLPMQMPRAGIYVFSEGGQTLYVGRSNDIRGRIGRHCRPGATHRMAAFAFRLAREKTGRLAASYTTAGSRADLIRDAAFLAAFNEAKARIRKMDLRYVEAVEPVTQALLEMYAAVALDARYNDFDNH
jgi:predicted GIY-YIG superfamily endonuclease